MKGLKALAFIVISAFFASPGFGATRGPFPLASPRANNSKAVILFLDFNLSTLEVNSAQDAANELGANLRVLPAIPEEERNAIKKIRGQIKDLKADYEAISEKVLKYRHRSVLLLSFISRWNYEEKARNLAEKIKPLEDAIKGYEQKYQLNEAALRAAFRNLSRNGEYLATLVISGHSRGDHFWGSIGEQSVLNRDEIFSVLQDYPKFTSQLGSVFLWGCYGGTLESVLAWTNVFPQIKNVFGFSGSAPSNLARESYLGLKNLLLSEVDLTEKTTASEVEKWFSSQSQLRDTLFVAKTHDFWVSTREPVASFRSMRVDCDLARDRLAPHFATFKNYFAGIKAGFEFPPNEKELRARGATSPLREAYEAFQKYFVCQDDLPELPDRSVVVALIHYEQVQQSFSRARFRELERWNTLAREFETEKRANQLVTPKGLSFGVVSRKQIREWSRAIAKWLEDFSESKQVRIARDARFRANFRFMEEFYNEHLAPELEQLDAIPPTWTTE